MSDRVSEIRQPVSAPPDPSAGLGPGTLLDGRYRIASVAARGGRDTVFNALDERSRQRVRVRIAAQPIVGELAVVRHPSFPAVLRQGQVKSPHGRAPYVVLEWFDGKPLALPGAPLAAADALRPWAQAVGDLLDALECAHRAAGRPHGDLALASLWVGQDGRLRPMDLSAPDGPLTPDAIPYASPERLRGTARDVRSDVYSVGALAYALATGNPPFGVEPLQARTGHLLWRLPEHPALPPSVMAVLRTAMEKAPHHRFASAARMKVALEQAMRLLEPGAAVGEIVAFDPRTLSERAAGEAPEVPLVLEGPISEDVLSLDGTLDPAPTRFERERRKVRRERPAPVLPLLLSSAGLALSVFAWAALLGLLAAVGSGRLVWP